MTTPEEIVEATLLAIEFDRRDICWRLTIKLPDCVWYKTCSPMRFLTRLRPGDKILVKRWRCGIITDDMPTYMYTVHLVDEKDGDYDIEIPQAEAEQWRI